MENKTSKYFKYAIGEIVLVVIGILIALQINNWNENKKLEKTEKVILMALQQELLSNTATIKVFIEENKIYFDFSTKLIDSIKADYNVLKENSITSSLNYRPLKLDFPILENILSTNMELKTIDQKKLTKLRQLSYAYQTIDKSFLYLDEFWNSKAISFFIATGINYSNSMALNDSISLDYINKSGYNKRQFVSLISINKDLQKLCLRDLEKAFNTSKEIRTK